MDNVALYGALVKQIEHYEGGADLEANKTATIDVSQYSGAVEITPTSGNDAMKKATVTLSNIPVIESNKAQTIDVSEYTEAVEITPTSGKDGMAKATVTLSNIPSGGATNLYCWKGLLDGNTVRCYTASETPNADDNVFINAESNDMGRSTFEVSSVTSFSDNVMLCDYFEEIEFMRDSIYDISLS